VIVMKRYKFQALVTLDPSAAGAAPVRPGQMRRMVVRGQHHETHDSQVFSALVTDVGEVSPRWDDDHVSMTIAVACAHPHDYFDVGDHFALWLGGDIGQGVVTGRAFL
jgi:hypothetical protein